KAVHDGQDIEARSGMSFAALTSGICLANAGLGVVHGFAASIGGLYNIPHGVVCGTLMSATNRITVQRLRTAQQSDISLKKYAQMGRIFLGKENKNDGYLIDGFLDFLDQLTDELRLPGLRKAGIREEDLARIARLTENKNNPVKLTPEDLLEILMIRYI
ncbi:MAG: iron-containing alcohol dehydrogenase, partial [Bacteroidales bacterium]|nr:iron-containing alcohol dehydrogenase [Bacteroidales bacterium]